MGVSEVVVDVDGGSKLKVVEVAVEEVEAEAEVSGGDVWGVVDGGAGLPVSKSGICVCVCADVSFL